MCATCPAHLILLDFITQSPAQYKTKIKNDRWPHHSSSSSCHLDSSLPFNRSKDCTTAATFCNKLSTFASQQYWIWSGLFAVHFVRRYSNVFTHTLHEQINLLAPEFYVRHPQHTQTGSKSSTIAADSSNGVTNTRCCRYSCIRSWCWVEVPPETCRAVSGYK
jgi:hypothetical protein